MRVSAAAGLSLSLQVRGVGATQPTSGRKMVGGRYTRLLALLAVFACTVGPAQGGLVECSKADTWQQKKRCMCTRCPWYTSVLDTCVPPDGVCRDGHSNREFGLKSFDDDKLESECEEKMAPSMHYYCTDEGLIDNSDECCSINFARVSLFLLVLAIDFFLFQWWFNKFDVVITCLCPSLYDFALFIKDEIMSAISSGEDAEEED